MESDEEYLDDDTLDPSFLPDDVEQSDDNMDEEVENVNVEPMPQPSTSAAPTTKRRKRQKTQSSWHVNDDCDLNFPVRDAEDSPSGASTPLAFVEMFWPAEIFEILARETNIRRMAETGRELNCSATEMKKFLSISLLMGCIKYPRIKMYWRQVFAFPSSPITCQEIDISCYAASSEPGQALTCPKRRKGRSFMESTSDHGGFSPMLFESLKSP